MKYVYKVCMFYVLPMSDDDEIKNSFHGPKSETTYTDLVQETKRLLSTGKIRNYSPKSIISDSEHSKDNKKMYYLEYLLQIPSHMHGRLFIERTNINSGEEKVIVFVCATVHSPKVHIHKRFFFPLNDTRVNKNSANVFGEWLLIALSRPFRLREFRFNEYLNTIERRKALSMGLHINLGKHSPLRDLSEDNIRLISRHILSKEGYILSRYTR